MDDPFRDYGSFADPMYWNGYIEKVGTGTEDIINKCREYGLKTPEFYQEEDFRVVIWRADEGEIVPRCTRGVPECTRATSGSDKSKSINIKR